MQNPLRASRTRIAAVAAAVLFGAGAGAAVVTALDSDQNAPQVSASAAASPIATSTSTVGEIYERSAAGVVEITVGSAGLPGAVRTFKKLSDARREVGMSRIYGGIHTMSANIEGQKAGIQIADWVFANSLPPVGK